MRLLHRFAKADFADYFVPLLRFLRREVVEGVDWALVLRVVLWFAAGVAALASIPFILLVMPVEPAKYLGLALLIGILLAAGISEMSREKRGAN